MPEETSGFGALAQAAVARFPDEAARLFESADDVETAALLDRGSAAGSIAVLDRLTPDRAARVMAFMAQDPARRALAAMQPNRAAALLARLDPTERDDRLSLLDPGQAQELRELASYPAETAGALMDPRVTTFRPDATVREVIRRLRRFRNRRIQDVFLVDGEGRLAARVALQDVVLADAGETLESLASGPPPHIQALAPRDEVVGELARNGSGSLAVVDFEGRLLGVLRQEELVAAAREQAIASAVTMVGASRDERALSTPWFAVRKRLPWLQINLLTAFLAASVVGLFEQTIAQVTALAVLLPVVAGQSGNTGAQALAVTMRGLALREVRVSQWLRVAGKEVLAGAGNGVAVALSTALAVYLWSDSAGLTLVIGVSMVISMTMAGLAGAVIPMFLTALRQDPAQSSSIVLTTITDVVGFFSFLGIATLFASAL